MFTNFLILTFANEDKSCASLTVSIEKPENLDNEKAQHQFNPTGLQINFLVNDGR